MFKHAKKTRRRTRPSVIAHISAIALGCTLVAGGVSAVEISILKDSQSEAAVSHQLAS